MIRHIHIKDLDINACCGTQLPHLAHLGHLHVLPPNTPSTSTVPNKKSTNLYFVVGPRATAYLQKTSRTLSLISQALAVGRPDTLERVVKIDALRKETSSREKDLRAELAKVLGENTSPNEKGAAWIKRSEKATHDFEFMGNLASACPARLTCVTSSIPSEPAFVLVLSQDADLAKSVNESLKAGFEASEKGRYKGGGNKGRFMSKVSGAWGAKEEDIVKSVLDDIVAQ